MLMIDVKSLKDISAYLATLHIFAISDTSSYTDVIVKI